MVSKLDEHGGRQVSAFLPMSLTGRFIELLKSAQGFEESKAANRYEILRGKIGGRTIIVYNSGKIVYDEFLKEVREMLETILYEHYSKDGLVVGSDEAGKGEALGPLVVAAVALSPRQAAYLQSIGVADSKIIPDRRILKLAGGIRKASSGHCILKVSPSKLNEIFGMREKYGNLNDVLAIMHYKALKKVVSKIPEERVRIIVDRFDSSKDSRRVRRIEEALGGLKVEDMVGGEKIPAVAAASVLARASYLTWIRKNLGDDALKRIRRKDYRLLPKEKIPLLFKIRYLKG
ncbi:MAG: hypothetical protein ACUVUS_01765 [Thermoproteota archaeon]